MNFAGGVSVAKYTREDIIRIVEEEDVKFIRLQFTDIFGTLKNLAIPVSQLKKALLNYKQGDKATLTILRNGVEKTVEIEFTAVK